MMPDVSLVLSRHKQTETNLWQGVPVLGNALLAGCGLVRTVCTTHVLYEILHVSLRMSVTVSVIYYNTVCTPLRTALYVRQFLETTCSTLCF